MEEVFLKNLDILRIIKQEYNIEAKEIEKIKGAYRIEAEDKVYCLKVVKYELPHFLFILSAINHLNRNGFKYAPQIIKTVEDKEYISIGGFFAYITYWLKGREISYDNPIELSLAARKLAELHKASQGFLVEEYMKPRVGWLKWIEVYRTRRGEILDFRDRIYAKKDKTLFDFYFLQLMEEALEQCDKSIDNLCSSRYEIRMLEEIKNCSFCHHDYAHHNILIGDNNELNIIDFDYCILDTHLHDLSSLLIRTMKYDKWNEERMKIILKSYNEIYPLKQDEIPIMAAFMEFPQDYWQRGIQYYWEKKPWDEEFFIKKIKAYADDKEYRQEFLERFRGVKISDL